MRDAESNKIREIIVRILNSGGPAFQEASAESRRAAIDLFEDMLKPFIKGPQIPVIDEDKLREEL